MENVEESVFAFSGLFLSFPSHCTWWDFSSLSFVHFFFSLIFPHFCISAPSLPFILQPFAFPKLYSRSLLPAPLHLLNTCRTWNIMINNAFLPLSPLSALFPFSLYHWIFGVHFPLKSSPAHFNANLYLTQFYRAHIYTKTYTQKKTDFMIIAYVSLP